MTAVSALEVSHFPAWLLAKGEEHVAAQLPAWLNQIRRRHWRAFLQNGLPTSTTECFKYTDLSFLSAQNAASQDSSALHTSLRMAIQEHVNQYRISMQTKQLLVFVDGRFMPSYSDSLFAEGVIANSVMHACEHHPALLKKHWPMLHDVARYPFAFLSAALFSDGLFLFVPEHYQVLQPIYLLNLSTSRDQALHHVQHVVVLAENSQCTLIEEQASLALTQQAPMLNIVTSIAVKASAILRYYKVQQQNQYARQMASTFVQQEKNSEVSCVNFSLGSIFSRDDLNVALKGMGAKCLASGFYQLAHDDQYHDHHIDVQHLGAHTESVMLYKGILNHKSRAVFNGKLQVSESGIKTSAYQANHNLLLSNLAEIYSKPELEIYTDEVKCKHGATTGQLDEEALFYLCSRGIQLEEAMQLLIAGFAGEILEHILDLPLKKHLNALVRL